MHIIRKAFSALGGIFLAALLITALAPKAARAVVATLVQVANTTSNPVPTVSANDPANFPFAAWICASGNSANCGTTPNVFNVPTTTSTGLVVKRLVIEELSGFCGFSGSPSGVYAYLTVSLPADNIANGITGGASVYFPMPILGLHAADNNSYLPVAPVRVYADPGSEVFGGFASNSPSPSDMVCLLNPMGYLETK